MYSARTKETVLSLIFATVAIASGSDLVADLSHGATTDHIVKETIIVSSSLAAIAWLLSGLRRQRFEISSLRRALDDVDRPQTAPRQYVLEARKKLGDVVTRQFTEWTLTGSEIEVGWLLLKGLSLAEIAIVRNTQERTIQQQASSIYKKAGVSGRHAFSAWFIEAMPCDIRHADSGPVLPGTKDLRRIRPTHRSPSKASTSTGAGVRTGAPTGRPEPKEIPLNFY